LADAALNTDRKII